MEQNISIRNKQIRLYIHNATSLTNAVLNPNTATLELFRTSFMEVISMC